jgi:hypothetical protein
MDAIAQNLGENVFFLKLFYEWGPIKLFFLLGIERGNSSPTVDLIIGLEFFKIRIDFYVSIFLVQGQIFTLLKGKY